MTALAGIWRFGGAADSAGTCRQMVAAQSLYARRNPAVRVLGDAALGCARYDLLPEDRFDTQPYLEPERQWLVIADVRLDNRDELLDQLGLRADAEMADSELLFRGYAKWRDGLYERLFGDYALAVWDSREQSLTLARDHAGQRPLHYHVGDGFVALSSMPQGLHALPEIERALEPRELAFFLSGARRRGPETFFRDLFRVEPGHVVRITASGVSVQRHWHMPVGEVRFPNQSDYVEAFRELLERATRSRLRGSGGTVAAHLSAGLDSSAVASTAAKIRPEGRVIAVTSAPRLGFSGPIPKHRIADESGYAAQTAALYPNMEHLVLRSDGLSPLEMIATDALLYQQPIAQPCNYTWIAAVNKAASDRGARVVLSGAAGNLTISAGGPSVLADFVRSGDWSGWWREARASVGSNGWRLRGVLASSFAPWVPAPLWKLIKRLATEDATSPELSLLCPEWRARLLSILEAEERNAPGEEGSRLNRWRMLQTRDSGNYRKGALARWGIDERDPTTDRRLTEFCLSLPPDQLLANGVSRRLARLALADRLPPRVLDAPRGYQFADWYEGIDRNSLLTQLAGLELPACGGSVLDVESLRELAASWPDGGWGSLAVIGNYRIRLLRALAAAAFASQVRQ